MAPLCAIVAAVFSLLVSSVPLSAQDVQPPPDGGGGTDTSAPEVLFIAPSTTAYTGTAASTSVSATIGWCDDVSVNSYTRQVKLDGLQQSWGYTSGSKTGCADYGTSTGTLSLAPGTHTLSGYVCDVAGNCTTGTRSFTYTRYAVAVTPDGQAVTAGAGQAKTQSFTIQNQGNSAQTFSLAPTCSGTGVSGCAASTSSLSLGAGASGTVSVSYTAGAAGTSGTVSLTATQSNYSAATDGGSISVSVPYVYGVSVTPDGASVSASEQQARTQAFTVKNTGNASASFNLALVCSGAGVSGCSASSSSVTLGAGASTNVSISYTTGAGGTLGTVTLTATQTNHTSTSDEGSIDVTVPLSSGVAVTPDGASVTAGVSQARTQAFTVRNDGNASATFLVRIDSCTGVSGCSVSPSSLTLAAGASGTATASYTSGAAGSSGTVQVRATHGSDLSATDVGSIGVSVPYVYGVEVTPDGKAASAYAFQARTEAFTVKNTGNASATFSVAATCTSPLTGCGASASSVTLAAGASTTVTASYTTAQGGTGGTVTLTATQTDHTSTSDAGTLDVTVPRTYGIAVTPDGTAVTGSAGQAKTQSFTVQNNGNASATFSLQVSSCTGVSGCSASASSVTLAAGATQAVSVSYTLDEGGTSGTVGLRATQTDHASTTDTGSIAVSVARTYGVTVTPVGGSSVTAVAGTTQTQAFTVRNDGNATASFTLSTPCTGTSVSGCSPSAASVSLAAGASMSVDVGYSAGAAGSSGTVALQATQTDHTSTTNTGSVSVGVSSPTGAMVPQVAIAPHSQDATRSRSLCVTGRAGAGAAYECGDLRLAHALPTVRTLGKARTPVLLYNSAHAQPVFRVSADVTRPDGAATPEQVVAELRLDGVLRASRTYAGTEWASAGETRRITLGFDAADLATDLYAYELRVVFYYGGDPYEQRRSGEQVVVNRQDSYFGAGWWLAGLERIHFPASDPTLRLLVGGDGSATVYRSAGPDRWVADALTHRPDTLVLSGGEYVRTLPGGTRVVFDGTGRHVRTVNRLNQVTSFVYVDDYFFGESLTEIRVPTGALPGDTVLSHTFGYDQGTTSSGWGHRLDRVSAYGAETSAPARTTNFAYALGDWRITDIIDPDQHTVGFAYGDAAASMRVTARTDRLGVETAFSYDALGTLTRAGFALASGDSIAVTFRAAESVGHTVSAGSGQMEATINGPRTDLPDVTRFWLGRFGAPTKVRDAEGNTTNVERTDGRFPALVTAVVAPNGFRTEAVYDARGNVTSSTAVNPLGDGRNATTYYRYTDASWPDFPTRIVAPEQDSVVMGYDAATGNRRWQQPGDDDTRRVQFGYTTQGLPETVTTPEGHTTTFGYDATYRNLETVTTPLGITTTYRKDQLGRDTAVVVPIDTLADGTVPEQRVSTIYDLQDRVTWTRTLGPAMNGAPEQRLIVETEYDAEGRTRVVTRSMEQGDGQNPTGIQPLRTEWRYDRAGRVVSEYPSDWSAQDPTRRDTTVYDPAGGWQVVTTRRGGTIRTTFDVLGRVDTRTVSAAQYTSTSNGIPDLIDQLWTNGEHTPHCIDDRFAPEYPYMEHKYPRYPTDEAGCTFDVPEEVTTFDYDERGNLIFAENRDAQVQRSYYPDGQLRTDSLRIQTLARDDAEWDDHEYGLEYVYDLNGRRIALDHPFNLEGYNVGYGTVYTYHPVTGALETITDRDGNTFRYVYDRDGQLDVLELPGGATQDYGYDSDGRLDAYDVFVPAEVQVPGQPLGSTSFTYDLRGKLLHRANATAGQETLVATYSGLGHLLHSTFTATAENFIDVEIRKESEDLFSYDPLGNVYTSSSTTVKTGDNAEWFGHEKRTNGVDEADVTTTYQATTGRVLQRSSVGTRTLYAYDEAGNLVVENTEETEPGSIINASDRVSYYGHDGLLRAVDRRSIRNYPTGEQRAVWEEYRYDPLGRRVLVLTRQYCRDTNEDARCNFDTVRRTVWDGNHELYETQAHESEPENDYAPTPQIAGTAFDPNTQLGRVLYTRGLEIDQPLSVTRQFYADDTSAGGWSSAGVFSVIYLWDTQGQAPYAIFPDGTRRWCRPVPNEPERCLSTAWLVGWKAYEARTSAAVMTPNEAGEAWMGSLLKDKQDASGLLYRRNRYYDPSSGRFTQEDPIGLAGGINLYGFAAGDPVNFSDPYGLSACDWCKKLWRRFQDWRAANHERANRPLRRLAKDVARANGTSPEEEYENLSFVTDLTLAFSGGGGRISRGSSVRLTESGAAGGRSFNPFRGRSAQEIDDMFRAKGFEPRGPDPVNGRGGYVNSRNGRSYHIDEVNRFNEPPHVDVNRPRGYKGMLGKRKFDM